MPLAFQKLVVYWGQGQSSAILRPSQRLLADTPIFNYNQNNSLVTMEGVLHPISKI